MPGNVLWAGLYWSGTGYQPRPQLDLRGPAGGYQAVSASSVGTASLDGCPHVSRDRLRRLGLCAHPKQTHYAESPCSCFERLAKLSLSRPLLQLFVTKAPQHVGGGGWKRGVGRRFRVFPQFEGPLHGRLGRQVRVVAQVD